MIQQIYAKEGPRAFYNGIDALFVRLSCWNCLMFMALEQIKMAFYDASLEWNKGLTAKRKILNIFYIKSLMGTTESLESRKCLLHRLWSLLINLFLQKKPDRCNTQHWESIILNYFFTPTRAKFQRILPASIASKVFLRAVVCSATKQKVSKSFFYISSFFLLKNL